MYLFWLVFSNCDVDMLKCTHLFSRLYNLWVVLTICYHQISPSAAALNMNTKHLTSLQVATARKHFNLGFMLIIISCKMHAHFISM